MQGEGGHFVAILWKNVILFLTPTLLSELSTYEALPFVQDVSLHHLRKQLLQLPLLCFSELNTRYHPGTPRLDLSYTASDQRM